MNPSRTQTLCPHPPVPRCLSEGGNALENPIQFLPHSGSLRAQPRGLVAQIGLGPLSPQGLTTFLGSLASLNN